MSRRLRRGLMGRMQQVRPSPAPAPDQTASTEPEGDVMRRLEERLTHLEQLVEGLQDSVHREAQRHDKRVAELEARIHPSALTQALDQDARERGL